MREIEILRRLLFVGGVLLAAAMFVWPAQTVWRVEIADFAKDQQRKSAQLKAGVEAFGDDDIKKTFVDPYAGGLDAFIADRTEGRLKDVEVAQWGPFYMQIQSTLSGKSAELVRYLEDASSPSYLYFPLDYQPLAALAGQMDDEHSVMYLRLGDGPRARYLDVNFVRSHNATRYAQAWVAYPTRKYAPWAFLVALAAYCLLPVRTAGSGDFTYSSSRSSVIPDWLGTGLTTFFFVLPILIIPDNDTSSGPFTLLGFADGWGILTLVMWGMACFGLAIVAVALWYATFCITLDGERMTRQTLFSTREYRFAEILSAEAAVWTLPTWLKATMVAASFLNWRNAGPVLLGVTSRADGMRLTLRNGRKASIWLSYMPRAGELIRQMADHGVQVSPALREHFPVEADEPQSAPVAGSSRIGIARIVALLVIGSAALGLAYRPRELPKVAAPTREVSPEVVARRLEILAQMEKLNGQMKQGLAAIQKSTGDARDAALKAQDALEARFEALQQQADALDRGPVETK